MQSKTARIHAPLIWCYLADTSGCLTLHLTVLFSCLRSYTNSSWNPGYDISAIPLSHPRATLVPHRVLLRGHQVIHSHGAGTRLLAERFVSELSLHTFRCCCLSVTDTSEQHLTFYISGNTFHIVHRSTDSVCSPLYSTWKRELPQISLPKHFTYQKVTWFCISLR